MIPKTKVLFTGKNKKIPQKIIHFKFFFFLKLIVFCATVVNCSKQVNK
jgi:hypothetical protein